MSDQARAGIAAAVAAAQDVDLIIAVLGEIEDISQESHSRTSLDLPGNQEDLLRALEATGKPVVLVLSNGRPLSVNWAAKHVPAIVEMWFPGEQGGTALADILFGDVNPSGKLSITIPKSAGQLPYNFPAKPGSQARDDGMVEGPLFAFGHGLSYTQFKYTALKISPERAGTAASIAISCEITNRGERAGEEIVQLYFPRRLQQRHDLRPGAARFRARRTGAGGDEDGELHADAGGPAALRPQQPLGGSSRGGSR